MTCRKSPRRPNFGRYVWSFIAHLLVWWCSGNKERHYTTRDFCDHKAAHSLKLFSCEKKCCTFCFFASTDRSPRVWLFPGECKERAAIEGCDHAPSTTRLFERKEQLKLALQSAWRVVAWAAACRAKTFCDFVHFHIHEPCTAFQLSPAQKSIVLIWVWVWTELSPVETRQHAQLVCKHLEKWRCCRWPSPNYLKPLLDTSKENNQNSCRSETKKITHLQKVITATDSCFKQLLHSAAFQGDFTVE